MKKEALFIVDNSTDATSPEWNGLEYLEQWCEISKRFDIATGYFDISALNALDGKWQQLDEIRILMGDEIQSSGYVLHTLEASIWCLLTTDNYANAVLKAVSLGRDTNTTGAVTGGLAGLYYGIESIPKHWLQQLARYAEIDDLAGRVAGGLGL